MPYCERDGVRLFYQQQGEGPDVVLVHAVTSNQAVWVFTGLVEALAADYRVTSYDLRGHGASDTPASGYTSADMVGDLIGLLDHLGIGSAALVGHSFGGVVAMHAASLHPDRVGGVILSDSYFPGLRHIEPNLERANVWVDLGETFASVGAALPETVSFAELFRVTAQLSDEQFAALEQRVGLLGRGWLRQLPRLARTSCADDIMAVAGLDEAALRRVAVPVAALYDEHSPFHATCAHLQLLLPRCTVELIPGAKHLALVQATSAFTAAVRRHLARMVPGARTGQAIGPATATTQ
jgi:3-oxoadipate enol-lactonase